MAEQPTNPYGQTPPPIPPGQRAHGARGNAGNGSLATRLGPPWLEATLLYLLPLLGSALCLLLCVNNSGDEPLRPIAGSAVVVLTYMVAFTRLNPSWVGLSLIGVILATYYVLSEYAVLW